MKPYSFTQPLCDRCWIEAHGITSVPVRMQRPEGEVCCNCGKGTRSGIYIRIDPQEARFPTLRP